MNSLQMIIKYWLKSKGKFFAALILQIFSLFMSLLVPIIVGNLVGRLALGIKEDNSLDVLAFIRSLFQREELPINILELSAGFILALIISLISYFFNRSSRIINADVASKAIYYIRKDVHDAIYIQSFSYFDKHETGQLVARATSDVDQTQMLFGFSLNVGIQGIISIFGVTVSLFLMKTPFVWLFILTISCSLLCSYALSRRLKSAFMKARTAFGELTTTLRENILGAQVVRIFSTQEKEWRKFSKNNKKFYDASVESVKYTSFFMPINIGLISILLILTLLLGGLLIIQGSSQFTLSNLIILQSYAGMLIFPIFSLGQIMIMYVQADAALRRVREVIESTPEIKEKPGALPAKNIKGDVEFKNVSFGYTKSSLVLKNISFRVEAGENLAILGTTGSGKSTIINLLPRFYDVSSGEILIDGINIKDYKIKELRKQIGIVSQDTFLFNKSILDNIRYGKEDATLDEVIQVAKIANIHDFIVSLPEKYNTIVGDRGMRLSGGQKQRLSIARALLIKPKILILDDSTSSVDVETEYKIQKAIATLIKNTTTFIITQRISTIRNADKILLLDKGRIVGIGTHEDLIKSNALYKQIFTTLYRKQKSTMIQDHEVMTVE
ncbi:MAG: ABC transporter ATP-binding protein [Promethearchaeota archaeon]